MQMIGIVILMGIYDTVKCIFMHTYVYAYISVTVECCGDVYSAFMPILLGLEHNFAVFVSSQSHCC